MAFAEVTTLPAKRWQAPSTLFAMVSYSSFNPALTSLSGKCFIASTHFYLCLVVRVNTGSGALVLARHRAWYINDLNKLHIPFAGYNEVVRIPSGATNIDVRQHSYSGKPEDDNYLGKTSNILF